MYVRPRDGKVFHVGDLIRASDCGEDHERFSGAEPPEGVITRFTWESKKRGFDDIAQIRLVKNYGSYMRAGQKYSVWLYHASRAITVDFAKPLRCRGDNVWLVAYTFTKDKERPIRAAIALRDHRVLSLHYLDNGQFYRGFEQPLDLVNQ